MSVSQAFDPTSRDRRSDLMELLKRVFRQVVEVKAENEILSTAARTSLGIVGHKAEAGAPRSLLARPKHGPRARSGRLARRHVGVPASHQTGVAHASDATMVTGGPYTKYRD